METTHYEPWMYDQVVDLLKRGFGQSEKFWTHVFTTVYDHPYQKDRCIRIVTLDGDTVIGFISYLYWPYLLDGAPTNSYQAVNATVLRQHRLRGVYENMLAYFDEVQQQERISFLVGIPEVQSYRGLVKNGWARLFDMDKYVKIINPLAVFKSFKPSMVRFSRNEVPFVPIATDQKGFVLNRDDAFLAWRESYALDELCHDFVYRESEHMVRFELKIEDEEIKGIRVKILAIGRIQTNFRDVGFLDRSLKSLTKTARKQGVFTFLYISVNSQHHDDVFRKLLKMNRFFRVSTKRKLRFMVKDYLIGDRLQDPTLWEVYKSDKDTW